MGLREKTQVKAKQWVGRAWGHRGTCSHRGRWVSAGALPASQESHQSVRKAQGATWLFATLKTRVRAAVDQAGSPRGPTGGSRAVARGVREARTPSSYPMPPLCSFAMLLQFFFLNLPLCQAGQ